MLYVRICFALRCFVVVKSTTCAAYTTAIQQVWSWLGRAVLPKCQKQRAFRFSDGRYPASTHTVAYYHLTEKWWDTFREWRDWRLTSQPTATMNSSHGLISNEACLLEYNTMECNPSAVRTCQVHLAFDAKHKALEIFFFLSTHHPRCIKRSTCGCLAWSWSVWYCRSSR